MKSSLTLNATAAATPLRCPTELVTKAVDGRTASPCGPLPFSCCVSAQRLNLVAFLIVMERPGHKGVLSQTSTTRRLSALPSAQEVVLISMSENSSTLGHNVFFMAEPASLKPKHSY